ncbi:MAG: hypothetical protein ACRDJU_12695, partial [Actinomycetota bacterium]
ILVVLGPVGWIALAVLAFAWKPSRLTVRLPMSPSACERERRLRHSRRLCLFGFVLAGLAALILQIYFIPAAGGGVGGSPSGIDLFVLQLTLIAIAAGCLIKALFDSSDLSRTVRVTLDASKRWVTLSRVHPNFAAAVADWQSAWY